MQNLEQQQAELPPEQRRAAAARWPSSSSRCSISSSCARSSCSAPIASASPSATTCSNEALSRVAQNLGYTLEELPTVLAAQNIDYATYRDDSRRDLIIEQLEQRDVIARIADHAARARAVPRQRRCDCVRHVRLQHLAHLDRRTGQCDAAGHRRGAHTDRRDPRPARGRRGLRAPRGRHVAGANGARRRQLGLAQGRAATRRCSPISWCA